MTNTASFPIPFAPADLEVPRATSGSWDPAPALLERSEHCFRSFDGAEIHYRSWIPAEGFDKIVVLLHRGHEHSARWDETARSLEVPGAAYFAWDQRGHGASPGDRGWAEDFSVFAQDLDRWVRHLSELHQIATRQISVVAHSVAAVIATAWVHDYAPAIRALVLATPAFKVKLYVPLAIHGLRVMRAIRPRAKVKSYVGGGLLTSDPAEARAYDADPAICRDISVNVLLGLYDTAQRLIDDAGAITTPVYVLSAGQDYVVTRGPQQRFVERLSSNVRRIETLPGFRHAIFHEQGRATVFSRISDFLRVRYADQNPPGELLQADRAGYTHTEFENLSQPLPMLSPRRLAYTSQKLGLATLGRLSCGISTGWRRGFDSGESLDAVYENQPRGFSPLGRLIDRVYLDSVGWRGIRQRKVHLKRALEQAIGFCAVKGRATQVVDIASGPGRYLLEFAAEHPDKDLEIACRDRSRTGVEAGRALAAKLRESQVTYSEGDAFNADSLAALSPKPDVAVVSGLYELFPGNAPLRASLAGLHAALREGGCLIYTNQPWHPQVEMIARVLPNREGKPWIMRRRTQAEMDQLVAEAGFEKLSMQIDQWGIFTVSIARKRPLK